MIEENSMKGNLDGRETIGDCCHWKEQKNTPRDLMLMVEIVEKMPDEESQHQMPIMSTLVMELNPTKKHKLASLNNFIELTDLFVVLLLVKFDRFFL